MALLIIGNGFDIAHHLPTQYSDFLDFVKAFKSSTRNAYIHYVNEIKKSNHKLYEEIQQLIEANTFIEYFLPIYEKRCKAGKKGWIDFESEISWIIQKLDEAKHDILTKQSKSGKPAALEKGIANFLKPVLRAQKMATHEFSLDPDHFLPDYFDSRADQLLESLNKLIRLLEIYLYEYVEKLDCKYRLPDIFSETIDSVLSFNYTDTYRKYYDPDEKARYCYIHGSAQDSSIADCNMVLGIDEFLPEDRVDQDNQFVWFKKFYQRIYKQTDSGYLDWINAREEFIESSKGMKPPHMDIYIYGHSLDITDKDVLSRLILLDNTTTYIFYHTRDSMAKQINNLVKVIGKDNLIRKTGGRDKTIIFVKSQSAKEI